MSVETFHNECSKLIDISYQLKSLSNSFFRVGNALIGNELDFLSDQIKESVELVRSDYTDEIHNRFKDAQQHTGNILTAMLLKLEK
jgi:hypothetical protein